MIHPVSPIDENHLLYGNFIGLQYIFQNPLNVDVLKQSVQALIAQFPALSGIYLSGIYKAKQGNIIPSSQAMYLSVQQSDRTVKNILTSDKRPHFIYEPRRRDVLKGHVPLSTFTLTPFKDGGMVFAVAISHVLTDAAGFHMLMQHLGDIYTAIETGGSTPEFPFSTHMPVFEFGAGRTKLECLTALKTRSLPKPISIKGLLGRIIKSMIIKAMDKSLSDNPPVKISFNPDQVSCLKTRILEESGEDWISTNMALCAHFTSLMAKLSYGDTLKTEMQIGQLLDLRGRYFEDDAEAQSYFVGNAILIHIDKATFPDGLQNTSRGMLARYFKNRQARTDAQDIKERLDLLADCLYRGYTNPELDVKNPIISLNNQSKMPVYELQFNGQVPMQIIPQDVGDNIMFFPTPDGGIEVYIRDIVNPGHQRELLTPEWQARIFDF